jgi:hypothetical protein
MGPGPRQGQENFNLAPRGVIWDQGGSMAPELKRPVHIHIARCKARQPDPSRCDRNWAGLTFIFRSARSGLVIESIVTLDNNPFNLTTGQRRLPD